MPATVLVADDDEMFRELVTEILTQGGYAVVRAEDGQAAWEAMQRKKVDIAVLDLNMPRMDGLELTRKIRDDAKYKDLPVLLLTVRAMVEDQVSGYDRGSDDYLTKPFDSKMLLTRVKVLERRALKK
ncbi:MAG: two-component response regulator [Elusimicrobia bacterium]|nr:MAG: two-component response regulator [Elusimicrobiota bacterium]